ncbi:hypothetical protein BN12_30033 [Nostocoides japonicum T1-X7]|uniref:Uncharacterized protein n=1 Tax=Nostocoides japonicum T1-X7 TaxID=1194083 RepID=A0A077M051_9MICO|nr:hypothetical protein BN12_30033 [Tetrasphaera japonica T1-X7]
MVMLGGTDELIIAPVDGRLALIASAEELASVIGRLLRFTFERRPARRTPELSVIRDDR